MIIEGKHSEVGQGIFISDIQENSNAEVVRRKRLHFFCKNRRNKISFSGWRKNWRDDSRC